MAFLMESHSNPIPHIGDIHLRAFTSFVTNHMHWWVASQTIHKNEDNSTLWIRGEPRDPVPLIVRHKKYLSFPEKVSRVAEFQYKFTSTCVSLISQKEHYALKGSSQRWEFSNISLRENDPYCFENFKYDLSRVLGYVKCMETCGPS